MMQLIRQPVQGIRPTGTRSCVACAQARRALFRIFSVALDNAEFKGRCFKSIQEPPQELSIIRASVGTCRVQEIGSFPSDLTKRLSWPPQAPSFPRQAAPILLPGRCGGLHLSPLLDHS